MIRLVYDVETSEADLGRADDGGIEEGHELETAVLISLFTDRRVSETEVPAGTSRAGWWGDAYADEEGDEIGSRLWLLRRGLDVPDAPVRAAEYAREALRWLVDDGLATEVEASARRLRSGVLVIEPVITLTSGTVVRYEVEV
ncbi:MAG: phage GP46 family protein [Sandaracinaceae bacterium]